MVSITMHAAAADTSCAYVCAHVLMVVADACVLCEVGMCSAYIAYCPCGTVRLDFMYSAACMQVSHIMLAPACACAALCMYAYGGARERACI